MPNLTPLYRKNDEHTAILWLRRDLRLDDNHALFQALRSPYRLQLVFIFDSEILSKLLDEHDSRVTFIYNRVKELKTELQEIGSDLHVFYGKPSEIFQELFTLWNLKEVYTNADYEPYAIQRDKEIQDLLAVHNIPFYSFKDHVIFDKLEILKKDDTPYIVFTPYKKNWLQKYKDHTPDSFDYTLKDYVQKIRSDKKRELFQIENIGFKHSTIQIPSSHIPIQAISKYDKLRDFPALEGTSKLGIHLRFGTISLRKLVKAAEKLNETYLSELIWREFYSQILAHFPYVVNQSFRPKYDSINWLNNEDDFDKWRKGITGYPLIDAGMRQLNATGYMHNRVRMVVASFLTKHLLIDWRLGEKYFADRLLDYELASNNGGWQWAAGSGTDAAPYFRIFNPTTQLKKFDPNGEYIRRWVPEFDSLSYAKPMIDHKYARERCLLVYKQALN